MPLSNKDDIPVYPGRPRSTHIVYDPKQREYYNTQTDIFLTDDDIQYNCLRPYRLITCPLPKPLPPNYFTDWTNVPTDY